MEFERLCNAAGPTNGKIVLRDGKTEPQVGGHHPLRRQPRRATTTRTARRVCCMAALKFGHLVLEKTKAEVYSLLHRHADADQKDYEEFYQRLLDEGMHFVRGKVAEVTDAARRPAEARQADRPGAKTRCWASSGGIPVDMVILMGAPGAAGRRQGSWA